MHFALKITSNDFLKATLFVCFAVVILLLLIFILEIKSRGVCAQFLWMQGELRTERQN